MLPTRLAADQRGMRPLYVPSQHSQYMVHRNKVPQPPKSPPRNCTLARSGFVQAGDKAVRVAVWNHSVDEFGVLTVNSRVRRPARPRQMENQLLHCRWSTHACDIC